MPSLHTCALRLALSLLLLLATAACSPPKDDKPKPRALPPALVVTATAKAQDVPVEIKTFGTMEASERVVIKPMISGELAKVAFTEGQDVEKGVKLFEIDRSTAQAALNKARAALARTTAIRDNARQDFTRYSQLAKSGFVAQEQAEGYRTKSETAAADVAADQAAVDNAVAQLAYCTITAPISGRIGELAVDRGTIVKANDTTLTTINTLAPIFATFTVPEDTFPRLQQRLAQGTVEVRAEVPGLAGETEKGTVSFLDNAIDPATGTIRLKAAFANEQKRLWPGQYLTLALTLDVRQQAVTVPSQAVQTGQKGQFVLVVKEDSTAEVRPVTPGPAYQGVTAIDKGLGLGEEVVIDGQMRVIPGGKVEVKGAAKPGAADGPPQQGGQKKEQGAAGR